MAILLRRLIISMLIPYLWRRWRGRRSEARDLEPTSVGNSYPTAPGARDVTAGSVVGEEY